ncbi:excinuclease ABC subunit UvrC [Fimbriimonadia bacterium ATM]|nr:MAG: excinuclease ABC subunit UvrC [Armatimonadota bacterium]MBC6969764.1 excinuclease ABC subunit UvrC [Armatimonadota bacterium]MCE7899032.1 excinuclease ABC subunit UvrC [Armatimonadetes bacterium ATM1]MDL1927487.1 excinuclease ABC subunit UvrC [Fimbriimonadia bacterium ATM]RIJ96021.1 MAG: excinuclease ABC subunit C [Armatimonadota bacterium]
MTSAREAVAARLKALPDAPGCYLFKDADGRLLYVGKAISLRNRVRSYFHKSAQHSIRIARMVARVRDIEWFALDSELEALVLECNLIKEHRPPYNVRLRDDKSYPYIVVTKEKFPRVLFTRKIRKDGSRYFGPYTSAFAVRDTLQLLHKVFKLIPCGKSWSGEAVQKPCLYYHMGRCLAPCAGLASREEHASEIRHVMLFLEGRSQALMKNLAEQMDRASERLDFERAASLRDTMANLESVLERQKVVATDDKNQDVIAIVKDDRGAAVQMFYVRGGKLIGQRHFYLDGASDTNASEAIQEFVKRYYTDAPEIPREVLLPVEIAERDIVQSWLKQKRGSTVTVTVPAGGEKLALVEMAATNAEMALMQFAKQEEDIEAWAASAGQALQEALELEQPPVRIECFDISNIQGTAPVSSMVVVESGQPAKDEYRRFKIRYTPEAPDDFAMMRETVLRRLRNYQEGNPKFSKLPDLIVIDGGKGQLNAALKAMDEIGLRVPAVGLAKKEELLYLPNRSEPIALPMNSPGLVLLRRLRDEAHRFAISYHRKLRDKRMFGSPLEEIPGVGPRRRRLLLRSFGSVEGIRRATIEDLAAVPTMTKALAARVKEALE